MAFGVAVFLWSIYGQGAAELRLLTETGRSSGGTNMVECDEGLTEGDVESLKENIRQVVETVKSLDEFERWLRSQHCIVSVKVEDYLVKTEPPAKEIVVAFKMKNGITVIKVIDIIMQADQTLRLGGFHDR
jgi:hypothetical protein